MHREGSLIAFYELLTEWEDQSGFPFYQGKYEEGRHHFELYITEFMEYTPLIKINYPNLYKLIIHTLSTLDCRDHFEVMLPMMNIQLINELRQQLQKDKTQFTKQGLRSTYNDAFKEIGIEFS